MIHELGERTRRGYVRAGRPHKSTPGQLSLAFPSAIVVALKPRSSPSSDPFIRALELEAAGQTEPAASAYLEAVKNGHNVADALCNLGVLACSAGDDQQALSYFSMALQREPGHPTVHHNLGNLFDDMGMAQAAQVHYEIAAAMRPSLSTYYNLALVLDRLGKTGRAVEVLEQCLREVEDEGDEALLLLRHLRNPKTPP